MVKVGFSGLTVLALASACNVSSTAALTAGAELDGGDADGAATGASACARAFVVSSTSSDFASTNISLVSPVGGILTETLISSGSAPTGLSTPLSGDVVTPLEPSRSGKVVLLDRYPNSVLTWVDPTTAAVLGQLKVGTGFVSNPHDYLEISASKAYVTRYETNPQPGRELFDGGGDVLVIDPLGLAVLGRIDLSTPSDTVFAPRPDHLLRVGAEAWVVLQRYPPGADFSTAGDARIVGISTADDTIAWSLDLAGVANCGAIAKAPSGNAVALSCTGLGDGRSAVVLLDATAHPPRELKRFDVAASLGAPPGSSIAFATETSLFGVTLDATGQVNDFAYVLDTASGAAVALYDGGAAFVLGEVRCGPGCTDLCFLADAGAKALRIWKMDGASPTMQPLAPVDPSLGLAPRTLGAL
jgi:hypothetical protein